MAATKWDDPNVDWLDEELGTLIKGAWTAIEEASDERNAYYNATSNTGFNAAETWPDLSLLKFKNNPSPINWANIMRSALQYTELAAGGTVDPDSITTSGTGWFPNPPFYDIVSTQDILDAAGWPAVGGQRLLHMLDSNNGDDAGRITKEWLKQWYQVLSFNVYNRTAMGTSFDYTSDVEKFYIKIEITYTWTAGVFDTAEALVTNPEFAGSTDVYVGGDLPEVTKATYQDLMDYGQTIFDSYFTDDTKWQTDSVYGEPIISQKTGTEADLVGNGTLQFDITYRCARFKRVQGYKPATGQRFDQEVWWNGYFTISGSQDTGETNNEILFKELPEDGTSLWIYQAILSNQGATPFTAPDFTDGYTDSAITKSTLNDDNVTQNTILFKPNLDDGTGWEYYTPAP